MVLNILGLGYNLKFCDFKSFLVILGSKYKVFFLFCKFSMLCSFHLHMVFVWFSSYVFGLDFYIVVGEFSIFIFFGW
jgi:hypothetical protein